jgi:basic amino acid/polyamine antiporter, APA family
MPREQRRYPRWIAWVGLVSCLALAASQRFETIVAGLVLLAVGLSLRWMRARARWLDPA